MSLKGAAPYVPWTSEEETLLRRLYPTGGVSACIPVLPNRTEHAIRTRVGTLKLTLTVAARFEICSESHARRRPPTEPRRYAKTAPLAIDAVVNAWMRRRAGGTA